MALLRFLVARAPGATLAAALASLVAGGASAALVALVHAALQAGDLRAAPPSLALAFAGACAVLVLARFVAQALLVRLAHDAVATLRLELCGRILATPLPALERLGAGPLLATLTDDVNVLAQALPALPQITTGLAIVAGGLGYLGWLSLPLLGITLAVLAAGVVSYVVPVQLAQGALTRARREQDALHDHLRGVTEGAKDLQLRAPLRARLLADLAATVASWRGQSLRGTLVWSAAEVWGSTLYLAGIGALLFVVPRRFTVEEAVIIGFTLGILFLQAPVEAVLSWLPAVGRAEVSLAKIEGLALAPLPVPAPPVVAPPAWRHLALRGVTYRHDGSAALIGPVDLDLRRGEVVFLVGGNGSGKTTLAKVLVGLYPALAGALHADGRPITDLDAHRRAFGAIFADSFLFPHLPGAADPPGSDAADAAPHLATLGLTGVVEARDGRLSTTRLSSGQRRRLLLLQAWLEDRPALVLDEWAADQDPGFRELFYRVFLPAMKARGTAVLVISHDDRYFDAADRIVRMEEGRVVSGGAPAT